ncbi:hypothetical protein APHAL10511_000576 [Amanita phalloides]|nr:hypothetical protein APHAL10511_000576 [Amanita phalloides]
MTNLPDDVQVEKCISAKGREYTITRRADSTPGVTPAILTSSDSKEDFGIQITWNRQSTPNWNTTSKDVEDTASISSYLLKEQGTIGGGDISCTIYFRNSKTYKYTFYDETGDSYLCNTWVDSSHKIDYYSKKPNLRFVTGS